jgi:hypothetical protein
MYLIRVEPTPICPKGTEGYWTRPRATLLAALREARKLAQDYSFTWHGAPASLATVTVVEWGEG